MSSYTNGVGYILNKGTINDSYGVGVILQAGGTVIDDGIIDGAGGAIYFGGTGNDLLVVYPGAVVDGTASATGSANIIELAAGSEIGTLAGIGTDFVGFGSMEIASAATWEIEGADSDEVARAIRDDVARAYEMMSPSIGASLA